MWGWEGGTCMDRHGVHSSGLVACWALYAGRNEGEGPLSGVEAGAPGLGTGKDKVMHGSCGCGSCVIT